MGSKQDLLQKGKYDVPRKSAETNSAYVYNKRKDYYGSNSKLQNDTYESVCSPEDTEERIKLAQRNSNSSNSVLMMMNGNQGNSGSGNNNRLLKRVVSAPVGIESPKGKEDGFLMNFVVVMFLF